MKPDAVVIDVGIKHVPDPGGAKRLVGDTVLFALGHARAMTPVPGRVGPMTRACPLSNTLKAAERQAERHNGP